MKCLSFKVGKQQILSDQKYGEKFVEDSMLCFFKLVDFFIKVIYFLQTMQKSQVHKKENEKGHKCHPYFYLSEVIIINILLKSFTLFSVLCIFFHKAFYLMYSEFSLKFIILHLQCLHSISLCENKIYLTNSLLLDIQIIFP